MTLKISSLDIFTVSFFGHRYINNLSKIESLLEEQIRGLLRDKEYVDFLVGNNGDYDRVVSSTIKHIKRSYRDDNSSHVLVLPYVTAEYQNNEKYFHDFYDEVEVSSNSAMAHFKAAIQLRNRDMVDRSDLIMCYVKKSHGGAYQTMQYAIRSGKIVINLATQDVE